MRQHAIIPTLAVASNLGNPQGHTQLAPAVIQEALRAQGVPVRWLNTLQPRAGDDGPSAAANLQQALYREIQHFHASSSAMHFPAEASLLSAPSTTSPSLPAPLLIVGGDHSIAMATWSAWLDALPHPSDFGLIWLDAHFDSHNYVTSPSGHSHGMPVRALLGDDDLRLRHWYPGTNRLLPENVQFLGIRSYEAQEEIYLAQKGVHWTRADQMGTAERCRQALVTAVQELAGRCRYLGLSLDLDVLDPIDMPDVATPAPAGIRAEHLVMALEAVAQLELPWLCFELIEYSPNTDHRPGLDWIISLLKAFYRV